MSAASVTMSDLTRAQEPRADVATDAFRAAFPDLYGRARSVARRVLQDEHLADDVAQETLARTFERWEVVSQHPQPVGWVLDVAWKVSMEVARRRDRQRSLLSRLRRTESDEPDERHLQRPLLVAAIARLSDRQRRVFLARYLFGHDVATTGNLLGLADQQVKDASRDARERLRSVLEPHEEDLLS